MAAANAENGVDTLPTGNALTGAAMYGLIQARVGEAPHARSGASGIGISARQGAAIAAGAVVGE